MSINPQNALKLSAWLAVHEPVLFRALAISLPRQQRAKALGFLGDDTSLDFTPDLPAMESTPLDTPDFTLDTISTEAVDVSPDVSQAIDSVVSTPPLPDPSTPGATVESNSSFWSQVGSGLGSAAASVGKLASALVSPQALGAAGAATAAYFNAQAKTAQTQAAQAVAQAQIARVNAGYSPATISYAVNPVTGARTPVYLSAAGTVPVTSPLLTQLSQSTGLSPTGLLTVGIGALIVITLLAAR